METQTIRSLSRRCILSIAGMVGMAIGTEEAVEASTIDYAINNNAGMIAPFENEPVSIAGHFNYDTATKSIENFNVTFTTTLEFRGTYTDDDSPLLIPGLGQIKIIFDGNSDSGVSYAIDVFLNDFGGEGAYDIRFIDAHGSPNFTLLPVDAQHRPTITALVAAEAPVPEPSTCAFALIGGALILVTLVWRGTNIRTVTDKSDVWIRRSL
jgi:hypothetical protein